MTTTIAEDKSRKKIDNKAKTGTTKVSKSFTAVYNIAAAAKPLKDGELEVLV